MSDRWEKPGSHRSYPVLYEKLIPIMLALIVVAIVVVLGIAAATALGWAPAIR